MPTVDAQSRYLTAPFALLLFTLLLTAGCGQADSPPANETSETETESPDIKTPPAGADQLGMLVSVEQLQELPDRKSVRILDVRPQAEFESGHLPGALPVDVGVWKSMSLKDAGAGLRDQAAWSKTVGDLGIERTTPVVVYSSSPTNAARIWWTLKYVGVKDVGILDGGWEAWKAADGEISTEVAEVEPVEFTPEFQDDRLSMIRDLKKSHTSNDLVVVDARSLGEYQGAGDNEGRIPGAAHLEWKELLDEDGRFKSKDELKKLFEARGITPEKTAVTHCQSGGRASLNAFALELVGYGKVKNYYCGWSEWGPDKEAPRKQGEAKPE